MRAERIWKPWSDRRVHARVWATKERPFVLFQIDTGVYLGQGECQPSGGLQLTVCNVGVYLSTYRWPDKKGK